MASSMSGTPSELDSSKDMDTEWGRAIVQDQIQTSALPESYAIQDDVDVAIVGGGLVGLAVAIGLTRNGIQAKVFERAPQLRSVSQGILSVQPNGMAALETINPEIVDRVVTVGCERKRRVVTTVEDDGSTASETSEEFGQDFVKKYGRLKVGITWHNMQQVLVSLLPSHLVVTDRSLAFFTEQDDHVLLHFTSQQQRTSVVVRAKVVLACEGVFSAARRQMFPNDYPIYFGQLNWGTVVSSDILPYRMHPPNAVHYFYHNGTPRWMAMLNDGGSNYTFFQFRVSDAHQAMSMSASQGRGGLGLSGVKQMLLPVAKPSKDVHAAIESIPESQIFERSIVGRTTLPTWTSSGGRVALVGDAAHGMQPNIAQGANSAFESAAAVVEALTSAKPDWKAALQNFERTRKPRADIVQRFANMMGVEQSTGQEFMSRKVVADIMDWILRNDPKTEISKDVVQTLIDFDPCSQEGVMPLSS